MSQIRYGFSGYFAISRRFYDYKNNITNLKHSGIGIWYKNMLDMIITIPAMGFFRKPCNISRLTELQLQ